jgi:uncharacterized protein (DUF58 family)
MSASGLPVAPEALLRRLEWRIVRRLDGRLQGDFRTLLHGAGLDVAELREYEPGDDVRHIDWNVTARMDTPYVRTFLEDRDVAAWLLLDRSASMTFGPANRPKESVQVDLAATLARILGRSGNPVGALLWNNGLERRVEPRSGRNQTLMIARHLLTSPPEVKERTRTDLTGLFELAERTIRRRSLIIVISDFLAEPGWEKPLALLNRRHEVVAIRLADPREAMLPDAGIIVVQDAETGELLTVDTSDPAFRARLSELSGDRDKAINSAALSAQVELHTISTEDDLIGFLVRIANRRKQRRRS